MWKVEIILKLFWKLFITLSAIWRKIDVKNDDVLTINFVLHAILLCAQMCENVTCLTKFVKIAEMTKNKIILEFY